MDLELYARALAETDPAQAALMKAGDAGEAEALARFARFYEVYDIPTIRAGVREVYAPNAFFGDPFHAVMGQDAIEDYFVRMAEPVESCTFEIDGSDAAGPEYYIRWTMRLKPRAVRGPALVVPGISHVRFDPEGLVVFQQDYWDSGALFDRLPVVGFFTRAVRRRLE
jgi:hypothetical protein